MPSFGATGKPETCLWCGRKLRRLYNTKKERVPYAPKKSTCCGAEFYVDERDSGLGSGRRCKTCGCLDFGFRYKVVEKTPVYEKSGGYGDGYFCGLRCGFQFGRRFAELGRRLQGKGD